MWGLKRVCKLKKALYGLKQSPRAWSGRLTKTMKTLGFIRAQGDDTLLHKKSSSGEVTILVVYVDDTIMIGNDALGMAHLQTHRKRNLILRLWDS